MTGPSECDKVLLVQAELDGELDAAAAAALAAHKAGCPVCREAAADITRARAAIDRSLYHAMPDALRARILAEIEAAREPERRHPARSDRLVALPAPWTLPSFGFGLGSFGLGAACAAALALLVLSSPDPAPKASPSRSSPAISARCSPAIWKTSYRPTGTR